MNTTTLSIPCIMTDEQYDNAQERLIELGRIHNHTELQKTEFRSIAALCKIWEDEHLTYINDLSDVDAVDHILFEMDNKGLRSKDLIPMIGSAPRVSELLNRKIQLSISMIRKLHQGLNIPLDVLVKPIELNQIATKKSKSTHRAQSALSVATQN